MEWIRLRLPESSVPHPRPSFRQLEYILKIAEENNITRAAEKLYISQSALNQKLLKLERELGCQLFSRSRTDWHLTRAGEIYYRRGQKGLVKFQQAGFKPDILLETSSTPSIVAMVQSALCCGILPRYYVDPADSRISCFVLPDHPAWDLCISYRKNSYLSRGAREFIRLAQEYWDQHLVPPQMDEYQ